MNCPMPDSAMHWTRCNARGGRAAIRHPRVPRLRMRSRGVDAARAGDLAACEHALLEWARASRSGITHLSQMRDELSGAGQRDALDALQRARWQGGDPSPACTAVADAFARGFAWRSDDKPARGRDADLPPLYPSR